MTIIRSKSLWQRFFLRIALMTNRASKGKKRRTVAFKRRRR